MTHDSLCNLVLHTEYTRDEFCNCDLIRMVREYERANVTAEWMGNHPCRWEYRAGQADMLAKCIAELEALMAKTDGDRFHGFWDAIDALRDLQSGVDNVV
jgi:hypothetical protein